MNRRIWDIPGGLGKHIKLQECLEEGNGGGAMEGDGENEHEQAGCVNTTSV